MSETNNHEVVTRYSEIIIKNCGDWCIVSDTVKLDLIGSEAQVCGKVNGTSQWYLWVDLSDASEIERAAKNHDRVSCEVDG